MLLMNLPADAPLRSSSRERNAEEEPGGPITERGFTCSLEEVRGSGPENGAAII